MRVYLALATNILRQSISHYLAAVALTTAALAGSAHAARFVDEPFDYISGSLAGQTGGVGFSGPWTQTEGAEGAAQVAEGSLQHPALGASGNRCLLAFDEFEVQSKIQRGLTPLQPMDGSVYWVSYLLKEEIGASPNNASQFLLVLNSTDTPERRVVFGVSSQAKRFRIGGGTSIETQTNTVAAAATGQTYLLVASISFNLNGVETARLFIDPALDSEPTSPSAIVTNFELSSIDSVEMLAGDESPLWGFDELRIGDSYFAVVPEPSVSLSFLLGAPLLLGVRRRRVW